MKGRLVLTSGIAYEVQKNSNFQREINQFIDQFNLHNWGDLDPSDKELNIRALKTKERIVAAYNSSKGKVYIITDYGHAATTVLFAHEY